MKTPDQFNICAILPFWRWAVSPGQAFAPGIPFYSYKAARKLFEEAKRELPYCPCYLLKRSFYPAGVDVIEQYDPRGPIDKLRDSLADVPGEEGQETQE